MNQSEKASLYDELLRQSDALQRRNSKLKSEYIVNIPQHVEKEIFENNQKIQTLVLRLESLFR